MKRRDFIVGRVVSLFTVAMLPWRKAEPLSPIFATVNHDKPYGIILKDRHGLSANNWSGAEVIDLDTGGRLIFKGKEACVETCHAGEGWAIVQDHSPIGQAYLDEHDEIRRVKVRGRFEIREV